MRKIIILGSFFAAFLMIAMPAVSAIEAESAEERSELQEVLIEQLKEIVETKEYEPAVILRLLLIIRNLIIGISALVIFIIIKIFGNRTAA